VVASKAAQQQQVLWRILSQAQALLLLLPDLMTWRAVAESEGQQVLCFLHLMAVLGGAAGVLKLLVVVWGGAARS